MMTEKEMREATFASEDQFLAKSVWLLSQLLPRLRDKIWHTKNENFIPKNEGETEAAYKKRAAIEAGRFKSLGLLPGVMDILCLKNGILYKTELKLLGKKLTESQEKLHPIWNLDCPQIPVVVAYTLFEVYHYHKWIDGNNNYIVHDSLYSKP